MMSKNAFLTWLTRKFLILVFLTGKLVRFFFFIVFLFFLVKETESLAGYNVNQTIFFFLTFNVIDVVSQFFFREVYRFRGMVVSGSFDLVLTKPYNPLIRVLLGGADVIDLITIPPLFIAVYWVGSSFDPSLSQVVLYILLIINGLLVATAFHVAVLGLGIITLSVDHTVMIWRDLTNLGRLPIEVYKEPVKSLLTYLIPVFVMISIPAKTFMGFMSFWGIVTAFALGIGSLYLANKFWRYSLRHYTSASS